MEKNSKISAHQLNFDFGLSNVTRTVALTSSTVSDNKISKSANVIFFQQAVDKIVEDQQVALYKKITSSISHLR